MNVENKIVPRSNHLGWKHYGLHLTLALKGSAISLQSHRCYSRLSGMQWGVLGCGSEGIISTRSSSHLSLHFLDDKRWTPWLHHTLYHQHCLKPHEPGAKTHSLSWCISVTIQQWEGSWLEPVVLSCSCGIQHCKIWRISLSGFQSRDHKGFGQIFGGEKCDC